MKTNEPQSTANNHKEGDILTIRNMFYGHEFKIGSRVKITSVGVNDYRATTLNGKEAWWVADQNFMTQKQLDLL